MSPVWDVVGLFAMRAAIYRMISDQGDDLYKTQISGIGRGMSTGVYYTHTVVLYFFCFSFSSSSYFCDIGGWTSDGV